jgi:hypothetical protein
MEHIPNVFVGRQVTPVRLPEVAVGVEHNDEKGAAIDRGE